MAERCADTMKKAPGARYWIAILTAVALVVGMLPTVAVATPGPTDGAGANSSVDREAAKAIILAAECSVLSSTANTAEDVAAWARGWLDGVEGLAEALGVGKPSDALALNHVYSAGKPLFTPAVPGTPANPAGTDGTMPFTVSFKGEAVAFVEKTCTVKAQSSAPRPFLVVGGQEGLDYVYDVPAEGPGVLTFKQAGSYTVTMPAGGTTDHRIVVQANATVVLRGVNIETSQDGTPPIDVEGHDVTLVLRGENSAVAKGEGAPGIRKENTGALAIEGDGSIGAQGGFAAAGIGGLSGRPGSSISVRGGTVTAVGGRFAAGIGGHGISIGGGTVNATGGYAGAGIGGAYGVGAGDGWGISISGGTVNAQGGEGATGIGDGSATDEADGDGWNISISGGVVNAQGGVDATGIGCEKPASDENAVSGSVSISGGTVRASSIGVKSEAGNMPVTISGGSINTSFRNAVPRYVPENGEPFELRRVVFDAPEVPVTRGNLSGPVGIPEYYGLHDVVPEAGKVYLWLDKSVLGEEEIVGKIINDAPCVVPSATANVESRVITWLNSTWLPNLEGLREALGDKRVSEVLELRALRSSDGSKVLFEPAVDGTKENPGGTPGYLLFSVKYRDKDRVIVASKRCTIEPRPYYPRPLLVEGVGGAQVVEGVDYDYVVPEKGPGTLTFKKGGSYAVSMAPGVESTDHRIAVKADATVTLRGVRIDTTRPKGAAWEALPPVSVGSCDATLVLEGESSVESGGESVPGIHKLSAGTLTVKGNGSITAKGGRYAAGIGGADGESSSGVLIESGTVIAQGGEFGAAIGGGRKGDGSSLSVNGGAVTASSTYGAAIGGGDGGDGSSLSVSNGTVTASSTYGAAIGGGRCGAANEVTVSDGTVTASSTYGAAIGGGSGQKVPGEKGATTLVPGGSAKAVTLKGGTVTASGLVGIGSGNKAGENAVAQVKIEAGTVVATGTSGPGVGAAPGGGKVDLSIAGGLVTATGGAGSPGIGSGPGAFGGSVAISGGTVRSAGGQGSPSDLGAGDQGQVDKFSTIISGGSVDARSASPVPTYDPEGDEGPFELRLVEYEVSSDASIKHENLTSPAKVPDYYGLDGVQRDSSNKIYLWIDKNTPLFVSGSSSAPDSGLLFATYTPGANTTLSSNARLAVGSYEVTAEQAHEIVRLIPAYESVPIEVPSKVALTNVDTYEPTTFWSNTDAEATYHIGDVIVRNEGQTDEQSYVVTSTSVGFLNAADLATGKNWKVTQSDSSPALKFEEPPFSNFSAPFKEVERTVVVDGVQYREVYESIVDLGNPEYLEYSYHVLYTLDGRPAGYYHVDRQKSGTAAITGHFNEGLEPAKLKEAYSGPSLTPVGEFSDGDRLRLLSLLSSMDFFLTGSQGPAVHGAAALSASDSYGDAPGRGGTLTLAYDAAPVLQRFGGDSSELFSGGRFEFVGAHLAQGGIELAVDSRVEEADGALQIVETFDATTMSPFVTLAVVEDTVEVSVKSVEAEPEPTPSPGPGPQPVSPPSGEGGTGQLAPLAGGDAAAKLVSSGDGSAAPVAALAVLALAACAALALARVRRAAPSSLRNGKKQGKPRIPSFFIPE